MKRVCWEEKKKTVGPPQARWTDPVRHSRPGAEIEKRSGAASGICTHRKERDHIVRCLPSCGDFAKQNARPVRTLSRKGFVEEDPNEPARPEHLLDVFAWQWATFGRDVFCGQGDEKRRHRRVWAIERKHCRFRRRVLVSIVKTWVKNKKKKRKIYSQK